MQRTFADNPHLQLLLRVFFFPFLNDLGFSFSVIAIQKFGSESVSPVNDVHLCASQQIMSCY